MPNCPLATPRMEFALLVQCICALLKLLSGQTLVHMCHAVLYTNEPNWLHSLHHCHLLINRIPSTHLAWYTKPGCNPDHGACILMEGVLLSPHSVYTDTFLTPALYTYISMKLCVFPSPSSIGTECMYSRTCLRWSLS